MTPALQLDAIGHRYAQAPVLRDIRLTIRQGEFVGLIGPNGSGKTTLMQVAAGVVEPDRGDVRIDGIAMRDEPARAKGRLGYGIDPALLPAALTGRQVLELVATVRGLTTLPAAILHLAESLRATAAIDRTLGRCSLGQRQKIGILAGLTGDPPLLLLDEPFNGLDPLAAFELRQHLVSTARNGRAAIILATHALDVAERCIDRAILMLDGGIVRDWDAEAIRTLRASSAFDLEAVMIDAIRRADAIVPA